MEMKGGGGGGEERTHKRRRQQRRHVIPAHTWVLAAYCFLLLFLFSPPPPSSPLLFARHLKNLSPCPLAPSFQPSFPPVSPPPSSSPRCREPPAESRLCSESVPPLFFLFLCPPPSRERSASAIIVKIRGERTNLWLYQQVLNVHPKNEL